MSTPHPRLAPIESLPLHRQMGVERIHCADGTSLIELTIGEHALSPRGSFHGGVAYTLCDMACYCALLSQLAPNEDAATHDIHVSVLRTAKLGDRISVRGKVLKRGRNVAFMEAELSCGDRLLAKASVAKTIITGAA